MAQVLGKFTDPGSSQGSDISGGTLGTITNGNSGDMSYDNRTAGLASVLNFYATIEVNFTPGASVVAGNSITLESWDKGNSANTLTKVAGNGYWRKTLEVGSGTGAQHLTLSQWPLRPFVCEFRLTNNTGQSISSITVRLTPYSEGSGT
jgi:hypothetical protein